MGNLFRICFCRKIDDIDTPKRNNSFLEALSDTSDSDCENVEKQYDIQLTNHLYKTFDIQRKKST